MSRGGRVAADESVRVPVGVDQRRACGEQTDGGNTGLAHGQDLAGIRDAIAVGVLPNPQRRPYRIVRINSLDVVNIVLTEGLEAAHRLGTVGQFGRRAKHLTAVGNCPTTGVIYQEAASGTGPGRLLLIPGVPNIELYPVVDRRRRHSIARQIKNQW